MWPAVNPETFIRINTIDDRNSFDRLMEEAGEDWPIYMARIYAMHDLLRHPRMERWVVQRAGHRLINEAVLRVAADAALESSFDVDSVCERVEALVAQDPADAVPPQ